MTPSAEPGLSIYPDLLIGAAPLRSRLADRKAFVAMVAAALIGLQMVRSTFAVALILILFSAFQAWSQNVWHRPAYFWLAMIGSYLFSTKIASAEGECRFELVRIAPECCDSQGSSPSITGLEGSS